MLGVSISRQRQMKSAIRNKSKCFVVWASNCPSLVRPSLSSSSSSSATATHARLGSNTPGGHSEKSFESSIPAVAVHLDRTGSSALQRSSTSITSLFATVEATAFLDREMARIACRGRYRAAVRTAMSLALPVTAFGALGVPAAPAAASPAGAAAAEAAPAPAPAAAAAVSAPTERIDAVALQRVRVRTGLPCALVSVSDNGLARHGWRSWRRCFGAR
jgi:hypothetical protein